ncbi:hypothetical protein [Dinghuibacter silviterrae]|uniref:Uncharacterized protein n=1 Tax=Dinghuibacter silviterrae TaxID=1539049 RepID=A0A4R8DQE7_9BACT|nr:hypothetical protein [Dinghuibacter silviterrae]TDX00006.1 hypothetical protein EDB95_1022 [Dinghuibacter silviterrae]
MMDEEKERVEKMIQALIEKAKKDGLKYKPSRGVHNRSSLHQIIKTKEQADRFMHLLKNA